MTAGASEERRPRRYRDVGGAVVRLWRLNPPLTVVWVLTGLLGALVPLALTVMSGRVVGAVPGVVAAGFDSPAGRRLAGSVVAMAVLTFASLLVESARWRSADLLGRRLRADQRQRIMAAVLQRKGIGHADDPAVHDAAVAADNDWLRGVPEGILNVVGTRIGGYGSALLVARQEPLGAAVLAVAWFVGGRWKWRRAVEDAQANQGQVRDLRRSSATADIATSPQAAKEIRLFGLGDWLGARYVREWRTAMAEIWALRRRGAAEAAGIFALLLGAHLFAMTRIAFGATSGRLGLGDLAVVVQAVLGTRGIGGVPYGHQEIEYGLRAVPAIDRLEAMLAQAPDLEGRAPAPRLTAGISVEGVRFRYPRSERDVLDGVDFEVRAGTSVAIVGDNGAGKSTLVQLLARLRDPTGGRITVDGTDLAAVDPVQWQASVAAVSQNALRLPLPARANVAGGRAAAASDAVLDEA
ncbi:MAG: ATP-binding cassette domain-containing protein, partial [Acidimicrobiales bacterium]